MRFFFVITCLNVLNVWPKTALLPVQHRDAKSLDTPAQPLLALIWEVFFFLFPYHATQRLKARDFFGPACKVRGWRFLGPKTIALNFPNFSPTLATFLTLKI